MDGSRQKWTVFVGLTALLVSASMVGVAVGEQGAATFSPEPPPGAAVPSFAPAPAMTAFAWPTVLAPTATEPAAALTAPPEPTAVPMPAAARPGGIPSPTTAVATRVVISNLGIDLPVMRQTTSYPACNVAMYLTTLKQPGQGGVTYLYAHARVGMFLALLTQSKIDNGAAMVGMAVVVYTGESVAFTYRVTEVRRHVTSLKPAFAWRGESLWLQTSEGPGATYPKLQLVATLVSRVTADFEAAHPAAYPVRC